MAELVAEADAAQRDLAIGRAEEAIRQARASWREAADRRGQARRREESERRAELERQAEAECRADEAAQQAAAKRRAEAERRAKVTRRAMEAIGELHTKWRENTEHKERLDKPLGMLWNAGRIILRAAQATLGASIIRGAQEYARQAKLDQQADEGTWQRAKEAARRLDEAAGRNQDAEVQSEESQGDRESREAEESLRVEELRQTQRVRQLEDQEKLR